MPRLRGPRTPDPDYVPLYLGLSPSKADALETRVAQLLNRWHPQTDTPSALAREIYELIAWVLDGESPDAPLRSE